MRKILLLMFLLLAASHVVYAQTLGGANGDCTIGGQQVITQGASSSSTQQIGTTNVLQGSGVQASFPFCQVNVYQTGTLTPAAIFSTNGVTPTPLTNPFIGNIDGSFTFFASQSICYDIVISTGNGPSLPYARTYSDVCLGGGGSGGGGIGTINAVNGLVGGGTTPIVNIGLTTSCPGNSLLLWDGSNWNCSTPGIGTITGITTLSTGGLAGGGTSGTLGLSLGSCAAGQVWQSSSPGIWACAPIVASVAPTSGGGLVGAGTSTNPTLGLLTSCSNTQTLAWNGASWACANAAGGGTPGGAVGAAQYNFSGAFGGFGSWSATTSTFTIPNLTVTGTLSVQSPFLNQTSFPATGPVCPNGFVSGQTCWGVLTTGQIGAALNGAATLFAFAQQEASITPSTAACWDSNAILASSGCGSAGNVSTTPGGTNQEIVQGASAGVSTVFDSNNLANIRYVTPSWNFSLSPGGTISPGPATITFPTCPLGVDVASAAHNYVYAVYLSGGTGTAEVAPVTGGTCVPGAAGTIIVTAANSHSGAFTVTSSTQGIQEAWNDAWVNDAGTAPNASSQAAPYVKLESNTSYLVRSSVFLRGRGGILDGAGAIVACSTRDRCIYVGITSGSPGVNHHKLYNLTMITSLLVDGANVSSVSAASGTYTVTTAANHPFVAGDTVDCEYHSQSSDAHWMSPVLTTGLTATQFQVSFGSLSFSAGATTFGFCNIENAAIEDNSDNVVIQDIHLIVSNPIGTGAFNYGIVNDNDQHLAIERAANRSASSINPGPSHRTSIWPIGAFVYERNDQGNDGITYLLNSEFTNINCVTGGGNGLVVTNTICQANPTFGFRYFGGLQPATFENNYEENGLTNPLYSGSLIASMGYLSQGGFGSKFVGTWPIAGVTPTFTGTGSSCTQRNYYVVPHSSALSTGIGPVIYIGTSGTASCSSTVNLQWPSTRLQDTSSLSIGTLTWDVLATTGLTTPPPNGTGSYLVSGGTGISGSCTTTGMCSFTDNQSALTSYTVARQTFHPTFWFWPAALVVNSATPLVFDSLPEPISIVSQQGTLGVSAIAQQCYAGGTIPQYARSPVWLSCINGPTSGGAGSQATVLQQVDQSNNGPLTNSKGRINLGSLVTLNPNDLITFQDSNFAKTLATAGERPSNDANDMASGVDNSGGGFYTRAPTSIDTYIGRLADNTNYVDRKTSTGIVSNVPVTTAGLNDTCADVSVSANSITCAMGTGLAAFVQGQLYWVVPANTNTGATTVTINALVPVSLTKGGASAIALQGGEVTAGQGFWAYYDGTELQVFSNGRIDIASKAGADMGLKIRKALADMPAGSAYLDAKGLYGPQTWSVNPFIDIVGQGYLPTKTGVLDIGCQLKVDAKMSNVLPTGWELAGCNNNFVGNQNSIIQADASSFVGFYKTGTITCPGSSGTPSTSICTLSGGTFTAAMQNATITACLTTADGGCTGAGANVAANPFFGTIQSINSSSSATILTPNGGGNAVTGVFYVIQGCVFCLGDNSTSGGGNQNFGVQIHGVTLDTNGVLGAIALWNSDAANMARAYNNVYTVSDNIGVAWFGAQAQNSDFDHFWITPGGSCTSNNAVGIFVRMSGASTTLSFGDGSVALGSCNTTGALFASVFDFQGHVSGIHYVTGSGASNVAVSFANGTPCPYACPVTAGNTSAAVFSDINSSGSGAAVISIGTTNSPVNYTLQQIKTIGSGNSYTNLIADATTGCNDTWATEKTLGMYQVNAAGAIGYSSQGVAGCSGLSTVGPISAGTTITATGGFVDKTIGFLTNTMGTQSTATPTPITTMSWTLVASKQYRLSCYVPVLFATSATIAFELVGPGSPTHYTMTAQGPIGAAAVYDALHGVSASTWAAGVTNASGAPGSGVTEDILIEAGIQNGVTGGTMTLDSLADGTHNIQILKDSNCVLTQTN